MEGPTSVAKEMVDYSAGDNRWFPLWSDDTETYGWSVYREVTVPLRATARRYRYGKRSITPVIRSSRGSDEVWRGLCYDEHHVWMGTVVVTLPETLPCVLRGKEDQWVRTVPHPHGGAISSDSGYGDVCVAQDIVRRTYAPRPQPCHGRAGWLRRKPVEKQHHHP